MSSNQGIAVAPQAAREGIFALANEILSGETSLTAIERVATLDRALNQPALRSVFKGHDGHAFKLMQAIVRRFLDSFSFSTKMSPAQMETFTVDALDHLSYDSLDDAVLFFKRARSGTYGVAKKGIDANLVFGDWLPQYLEEKAKAREKQIAAANNTRSATMEQVQHVYQEVKRRNAHKERLQAIDRYVANFERQMLEDTIVSWAKDTEFAPYVDYLKAKRRVIK